MTSEAALDALLAELHSKIGKAVDAHGWAIVTQPADEARLEPAMAYTVGLAEKGYPELLVYGLDADSAQVALNETAARLLRGDEDASEERPFNLFQEVDAVLKLLPEHRALMLMPAAIARFGRQVPVKQLVWSDESGRFPWDIGFNPDYVAHQTPLYSGASRH